MLFEVPGHILGEVGTGMGISFSSEGQQLHGGRFHPLSKGGYVLDTSRGARSSLLTSHTLPSKIQSPATNQSSLLSPYLLKTYLLGWMLWLDGRKCQQNKQHTQVTEHILHPHGELAWSSSGLEMMKIRAYRVEWARLSELLFPYAGKVHARAIHYYNQQVTEGMLKGN